MVCSFLWLSLEIKMFWKVMDKDISHRNPSLCWTTGEGWLISANPSAVTVCSQYLDPVVNVFLTLSLVLPVRTPVPTEWHPAWNAESPSLCWAAVGVDSPAHRPNTFSMAHSLGSFSSCFQFLEVIYCCFDTCWYEEHFSDCRRSLKIGESRPSPCQLTLLRAEGPPYHRASRLKEGATWWLKTWTFQGTKDALVAFWRLIRPCAKVFRNSELRKRKGMCVKVRQLPGKRKFAWVSYLHEVW